MLVSDFDFDLPSELIALRPHSPREEARLLVLEHDESLIHKQIKDLIDFLKEGDLMVVNDTRVIEAQLSGLRQRGELRANIEATLIKDLNDGRWQAFIKPGRKVISGDKLHFASNNDSNIKLQATVASKDEDGVYTLDFQEESKTIVSKLGAIGNMPLPPYIRTKRREDEQDRTDYQTAFAAHIGSVAAPTAGLHFTPTLLDCLRDKGVCFAKVTLHVGAGTFLPIKVEDTNAHKMHFEWGQISQDTADLINKTKKEGGRIISVGTTSLRLLESACDNNGFIKPYCDETDIFITPGRQIRSIDYLMTNFHLPKSTLFMLVCALSGTETMKSAYAKAISMNYRFFSYGDACLLPNRSRL